MKQEETTIETNRSNNGWMSMIEKMQKALSNDRLFDPRTKDFQVKREVISVETNKSDNAWIPTTENDAEKLIDWIVRPKNMILK